MSDRPRLLDLFCGQGGCARGYVEAGFDVTGVDLNEQPRYPLSGASAFVRADALEYLAAHGAGYDAIHASPPCQGYSRMRHLPWLKGRQYPMLIPETLRLLGASGRPWVVENVEDAHPALRGYHCVRLCGTMFGLKVYRHRLFASNILLLEPDHPKHATVIGHGRMLNDRAAGNAEGWISLPSKAKLNRTYRAGLPVLVAGHQHGAKVYREAMGIDWMTRDGLAQAIPPAYTRLVGRQLRRALDG